MILISFSSKKVLNLPTAEIKLGSQGACFPRSVKRAGVLQYIPYCTTFLPACVRWLRTVAVGLHICYSLLILAHSGKTEFGGSAVLQGCCLPCPNTQIALYQKIHSQSPP